MKAKVLVLALENLISDRGDVEINVEVKVNGDISHSKIEGITYLGSGTDTVVILSTDSSN